MSSYDGLLGVIYDNGSAVELRGGLNFIGVQVAQNEALNALNVTFTGVVASDDYQIGFSEDGQLAFIEGFTYDPNDAAGALSIPAGAAYKSNGVTIVYVLATDAYFANGVVVMRPGSTAANGRLGFYGTTPIVKPALSGDRSDGTALTNLITLLANLGLLTDNTVA